MKKIFILAIILTVILLLSSVNASFASLSEKEINLKYLDSMRSEIKTPDGRKLVIWSGPRVHAVRPDNAIVGGSQVTAQGSITIKFEQNKAQIISTEIAASTSEMSKVALAYMKHWEVFKEKENLLKAKEALNFLLYVQANDGLFYKNVFRDGRVDTEGKDSCRNLDLWAVRAFAALCMGYKIFSREDPVFARELDESIQKVVSHVTVILNDPQTGYGKYVSSHVKNFPAWLVNQSSEVSAFIVIGLCDYYSVAPKENISDAIKKLSNGILEYQMGNNEDLSLIHI